MSLILIVDDDVDTLQLIFGHLASAKHNILVASNGAEALSLLKENKVDAVVTDLKMPVLNGLRLIREIRAAGDTIPIVAISGVNADQLLLAEDYGANAGLTKPVDRAALLGVLDRIMSDTRSVWKGAWIHPEFGSVGDR